MTNASRSGFSLNSPLHMLRLWSCFSHKSCFKKHEGHWWWSHGAPRQAARLKKTWEQIMGQTQACYWCGKPGLLAVKCHFKSASATCKKYVKQERCREVIWTVERSSGQAITPDTLILGLSIYSMSKNWLCWLTWWILQFTAALVLIKPQNLLKTANLFYDILGGKTMVQLY